MRNAFEMIDADWMARHRPRTAPLPIPRPNDVSAGAAPSTNEAPAKDKGRKTAAKSVPHTSHAAGAAKDANTIKIKERGKR
jgi:hypothetical protein